MKFMQVNAGKFDEIHKLPVSPVNVARESYCGSQ